MKALKHSVNSVLACTLLAFLPFNDNAAEEGVESEQLVIEEIVVTAQKREERLQEVPIAVSAFDEVTIENNSVVNLSDLSALAPNVILEPVGAFPNASSFSIRGIAFLDVESTAEPAVGLVIDGVNMARNVGALLDMFDVERVEVLRGPQGTLFGKNNIGGLINVITRRPTGEAGGMLKLTGGNEGLWRVQGYVNTPTFGDAWSAKLSFSARGFDGYLYNPVKGADSGEEDVKMLRGTLQYDPDGIFDATLIIDYLKEDNDGVLMDNVSLPSQFFVPGGFFVGADDVGGGFYDVYSDVDIFADLDTTGVTLEANWELDAGTITSVTGWREMDNDTLSDFDGSAAVIFPAFRSTNHEQFSQELRFTGAVGDKLNYVAGVYYFSQEFTKMELDEIFPFFVHDEINQAQDATSWAVFAQADYLINDRHTLTVGGRYTADDKDYEFQSSTVPFTQTSESWSAFTPKLGWKYQHSEQTLLYASWSQGFRGGGFAGRPGIAAAVAVPYDEETVDSYEIGFKSDLLDRRLRFNTAGFFNDYDDKQVDVQRFFPENDPPIHSTITTNAAKVELWGIETELTALLTENLKVNLAAGYLHSKYVDFDADLNGDGIVTDNSFLDLPFAPEWTFSLSADYAIPVSFGQFTLYGRWTYLDEMLTTNVQTDELYYRDSEGRLDARFTFEDAGGRYSIALWGKNLTDSKEINNAFAVGALVSLAIYQPPRLYGVDVTFNF